MKKIIEEFNQQDVSLVISDYPYSSKKGGKNYGIAWYTKETLEPLANKYNKRFVVLGEKHVSAGNEIYANRKIVVFRVFSPRHHSLFPTIVKWLLKFPNVSNVYVHSEFCTNGGIKNFILLLPFLILIKLLGKNVTYFSHNVVSSFDGIAPHLNLGKNPVKIFIFNLMLRFYYKFLGLVCNRFVVMDLVLKKRLIKFIPEKKIILSPFWTEKRNVTLDRKSIRKKLDVKQTDFVLLYFGFITWYKGADWIIKEVQRISGKNKNRRIKLILAGGPAYSLKHQKHYQKYYKEIIEATKLDPNIRLTGFVPEDQIDLYFSACNLCIFPYRGYIGSSGAITHAISRKIPFLVSKLMSETFINPEYQKAFKESGLTKKDLVFEFKKGSLESAINRITRKNFKEKIKILLASIVETKSMKNSLPILYETVYTQRNSQYIENGYLKPIFNLFTA